MDSIDLDEVHKEYTVYGQFLNIKDGCCFLSFLFFVACQFFCRKSNENTILYNLRKENMSKYFITVSNIL
jgi:hypothetical protein